MFCSSLPLSVVLQRKNSHSINYSKVFNDLSDSVVSRKFFLPELRNENRTSLKVSSMILCIKIFQLSNNENFELIIFCRNSRRDHFPSGCVMTRCTQKKFLARKHGGGRDHPGSRNFFFAECRSFRHFRAIFWKTTTATTTHVAVKTFRICQKCQNCSRRRSLRPQF